jgi:hypothetical protein
MADFWPSSGYRLLERDAQGCLAVTDDFLRAYLNRPEIMPIDESLDAERQLHAELLANPGIAVEPDRLRALGDPDVEDNYRILLAFRDRLIAAGTIEACYRGLFGERQPEVPVPPLFIDQLVHVIMRHILDSSDDPFRVRAAELFFRKQVGMNRDGAILMGDEETVTMYRQHGFGNIGKLLAEVGTTTRQVELDVLNAGNAGQYWDRSDRFDMVLDLTFGREGLDAFCRVLEQWVRHFFDLRVSVQPAQGITDEHWIWHIGLDATASGILNDLYDRQEVDDERLGRLISLFRMEFADPQVVLPRVQGRPVYLALAMAEDDSVRLKPQNLLVNLPVADAV